MDKAETSSGRRVACSIRPAAPICINQASSGVRARAGTSARAGAPEPFSGTLRSSRPAGSQREPLLPRKGRSGAIYLGARGEGPEPRYEKAVCLRGARLTVRRPWSGIVNARALLYRPRTDRPLPPASPAAVSVCRRTVGTFLHRNFESSDSKIAWVKFIVRGTKMK